MSDEHPNDESTADPAAPLRVIGQLAGSAHGRAGRRRAPGQSLDPNDWAVRCPQHGIVYLTSAEYDRQILLAEHFWYCPIDGQRAEWVDQ